VLLGSICGFPGLAQIVPTVSDHGKIVNFYRTFPEGGRGIRYIHKGLLYFPSRCNTSCVQWDSQDRPMDVNKPYVVHFWYPKEVKYLSRIRIDPLEDVILDSPFEIVEDEKGAKPTDEVFRRAFSQLGDHHRGHRYNLLGNNCGNFVYWAKYAANEQDQQIWEKLRGYSDKFGISPGKPVVEYLKQHALRKYANAKNGLD
jgi:hypothetical protein